MYSMDNQLAYDKYSGQRVSDEEACAAADNPMIYKWVEWR